MNLDINVKFCAFCDVGFFYRDKIDFFIYSIVFDCNGYITIAQAINDIGRKRKK